LQQKFYYLLLLEYSMDTGTSSLLSTILVIFTPLLTVIIGGISIVVGNWMIQWQARSKVDTMRKNAKYAVEAIEQLMPTATGEEKAKAALTLAQTWNETAKIKIPDTIQLPMNEAEVLKLPPKEGESK
jgi:hypothetical protein